MQQGEVGERAYLCSRGEMRVYHETSDGEGELMPILGRSKRAVLLNVKHPGDTIGEMAIIERNHVRSATVVATKFCEFETLNYESFSKLRQAVPAVEQAVRSQLQTYVRDTKAAVEQSKAKAATSCDHPSSATVTSP